MENIPNNNTQPVENDQAQDSTVLPPSTPPQQEPAPTTSTENIPTNNSKKKFIIIFVVIFLVVTVTMIVLSINGQKTAPTDTPAITAPTEAPSIIPSPTASAEEQEVNSIDIEDTSPTEFPVVEQDIQNL